MSKKPKIIITDAAGLSENTEKAFLVLAISREEIESGNFASALDRLHVMTDSAANVLRYRESMVFQVHGYDEDLRELPEIPEVRDYFKRLTQQWPHWLWFLFRGTGSIALLLSLLCEIRVIRNVDGSFGTEFVRKNQIKDVLMDMFIRGNALFESYNISEDDAKDSADSAIADFST